MSPHIFAGVRNVSDDLDLVLHEATLLASRVACLVERHERLTQDEILTAQDARVWSTVTELEDEVLRLESELFELNAEDLLWVRWTERQEGRAA